MYQCTSNIYFAFRSYDCDFIDLPIENNVSIIFKLISFVYLKRKNNFHFIKGNNSHDELFKYF